MGLFSMRLVEHVPGVSRVYRNAIGYTTKIARRDDPFHWGKSYIRVSKSLELSDISHGRHSSDYNSVPIKEFICTIGSHLRHSLLDRPFYKINKMLRI